MTKITYFLNILLLLAVGSSIAFAQTVFDSKNTSLLSQLPYDVALSDIWGFTSQDDKDYALVATTFNFSIVDISDASNPVEVAATDFGSYSTWRDLKTWGDYAYGVDDTPGEGLIIMDLSDIDNGNFSYHEWETGIDIGFSTAHNIFIDEQGFAYLLGANIGNGGALILDLNQNPENPPIVGRYDDQYIHDAYVRGDTLWAAQVNRGVLAVIDISDKNNPLELGAVNTPTNLTHNCWLSNDGKTCFTTDETSGGFLTAYDVSDVTDIKELDRIQSSPGSRVIPHNTFVVDNFLITSYYADGLTVHDITYPNNMIEVGFFDSSNSNVGPGFVGAWGVYPFFSDKLLISDIENGLFVIGPEYPQACYLQGLVTDQETSEPVFDVSITIEGTEKTKSTDLTGRYFTGIVDAGEYTITYEKIGYVSQQIEGVNLNNGVSTVQNVVLEPLPRFTLTGNANNENGVGLGGLTVSISNEDLTYTTTTDENGSYSIPQFLPGTYNIIAGNWGYIATNTENVELNLEADNYDLVLEPGYYDDFSTDNKWSAAGITSDGCFWVRDDPIGNSFGGGFVSAPETDVTTDIGDLCYITGNSNAEDWVSSGSIVLRTPTFDLANSSNITISFYTWFANFSQNGFGNDSFIIELENGEGEEIVLTELTVANITFGEWQFHEFDIDGLITYTDQMKVSFTAIAIEPHGQLLECGVDVFKVSGDIANAVGVIPTLNITEKTKTYPNPFSSHLNLEIQNKQWLTNTAQPLTFKMMDITGRIVKTQNIANARFTVARDNLSTGVYFFTIEQNGKVLDGGKVIVED